MAATMLVNPLGLIALLAVPVVVALHLYRRRFEPRAVSALFLWAAHDRAPVAGRKREPLRTSVSFWCELLASALLALAFAGLRTSCSAGRGEHAVIVLDSSASMGAEGTRGRVVEELDERLAGLGRGSRVTLVQSGPRPSVLAGPAAFAVEARAALARWQPLAAHHDLQPALELARQFAGEARVTLVSDRFAPEAWPESVEVVALGRAQDNWALTRAVRTLERDAAGGDSTRVFLTVASFAASERAETVRITSGEQELARETVTLAPGARSRLSFQLPEDIEGIEVSLERDALAIDDRARLAPPPPRTLALGAALTLDELRALGLAQGEDDLARWLALVSHSVRAPLPEAAHLVLAHEPLASSANWTLVFPPQGSARKDLLGPFLVDRASPALEGTTFEGLVWSADPELVLPGVPLVSAGNQVLFSEERRGARVTWFLNLDPARSSLQRSPDWPILLANLAELRRAALSGPERTNLGVGERFVYRPGSELDGVLDGVDRRAPVRYTLEGPLEDPHRARREVPALEAVVVDDLEWPGAYRLFFGERVVAEFAVAFTDAAESDLRAGSSGHRAATRADTTLEAELSWFELVLILGALGAAFVNWFFLKRQQPVTSPERA